MLNTRIHLVISIWKTWREGKKETLERGDIFKHQTLLQVRYSTLQPPSPGIGATADYSKKPPLVSTRKDGGLIDGPDGQRRGSSPS
jgi:hypothetical protein